MTIATAVAETVLMGRCVTCKRPFRAEIPADVADRFGSRLPHAIGYALLAAKSSDCACSCAGRNHGGMHSQAMRGI
jgi:hypothetical protein